MIVGGGISGLVLSIALRRRGLPVDLVEIQPQWTVLGTGLSLTGPTLRALASIGIADQCIEAAFGFDRVMFCDAKGSHIADLNMPRLAGPDRPATIAIGRPTLHEILLRNALSLGAVIRLGTTIASLNQEAGAVVVEFSSGETETYDIVVGCDGAHSLVRQLVFIDAPAEDFTGLAVWRASMPRPAEVDCMQVFYAPRSKAGVNPHSQDEMFLFLVEQAHKGRRIAPEKLPEVLRDLLEDYDGEVMNYVREHVTDPASIDCRGMSAFLLPPPWHRGQVVLIGDAAHTTTPHLATGAGIAIEDAVVLAELLASDRAPAEVLDKFVARRFDRCRLVVETAVRLGEMEKDATIPIQAHFDLMASTFKQLAQPI
jgi:2-polyprenyl-6-methoxyphenol hydroxylase-like FAD-dependent oxidoreductase